MCGDGIWCGRNARLATWVSCPEYGCGLRDRCRSCGSGIAVFDQPELVPQHYCVRCGFDLRRSPNVVVSAAARRLDRCIDDICQLEAVNRTISGSNLVRRLQGVPAVAGVHSTSILIGLSTSARVRCFERLVERPSDWLTVDDDVVVTHGRRLILSAGGHGPLIALLANTLERQRQSPTNRRVPLVKLSALPGTMRGSWNVIGSKRRCPRSRGHTAVGKETSFSCSFPLNEEAYSRDGLRAPARQRHARCVCVVRACSSS